MDSVQKQVMVLSQKVDALYQMIELLSQKISAVLSANKPEVPQEGEFSSLSAANGRYTYQNYSRDSGMEHKDVLIDSNLETNSRSREKELSPEIQIQRLTAQLTAAYNRIAALEEQLLSKRIHS
jgi:hypothetical protein